MAATIDDVAHYQISAEALLHRGIGRSKQPVNGCEEYGSGSRSGSRSNEVGVSSRIGKVDSSIEAGITMPLTHDEPAVAEDIQSPECSVDLSVDPSVDPSAEGHSRLTAVTGDAALRRRLTAITAERAEVISEILDIIHRGLGATRSRTIAMLSLYPR